MSKKCDDFGVQSVVPSWNFFVSSVKYASGATRRPTDPPGARDACIGIHETFPAGVLARGTGIDCAVSHIATSSASRFSHKGLFVSSRAGGRVRLAQAAALRLDLAAWGTLCYADAVLPGLGPRCALPNVVLACAALPPCTTTPGLSHPELSPSHNASFRRHNVLDCRKACEASVHLCPIVFVGRHLG